MGDIWGRKRILVLGTWIFIVSTILCPLAPTMPFSSFSGGAGSGRFPDADHGHGHSDLRFSAAERGKALGVNVASIYLGSSAGPFFGGLLIAAFGWASVLYVNALLGAVSIFLLKTRVPFEGGRGAANGSIFPAVSSTGPLSSPSCTELPFFRPSGEYLSWLRRRSFCGLIRRMLRSEDPLFEIRLFPEQGFLPFQRGSADQLCRHLLRGLSSQPVPSVHQGMPVGGGGGHGNPASSAGFSLSLYRKTFGQD